MIQIKTVSAKSMEMPAALVGLIGLAGKYAEADAAQYLRALSGHEISLVEVIAIVKTIAHQHKYVQIDKPDQIAIIKWNIEEGGLIGDVDITFMVQF